MGRLSRIAGTAVGSVVVAAVLAGCGGPSRVGSALVVGDQSVPLASVQTRIDAALGAKPALSTLVGQQVDDPTLARYVVTSDVQHQMITAAAAREGVSVTDAQVDAAVADTANQSLQVDRTLFTGADLRDRARDRLLADALARKDLARLSVTADLVVATSAADADQKARTLAAGGPAADALLTDKRNSQRSVYQASADPTTATTVLFGMQPGAVAAFEPSPGQGVWLVARVVDRTLAAPGPGVDASVAAVDESTLASVGIRLAQADAGAVQVNPRFGVWDEIRLQVVDPAQRTGSIVRPA